MKTLLYPPLMCLSFYSAAQAQTEPPLPPKLTSLKAGYESALARATLPITQTYIQELQKLKTEYTRAGNLEAALATDKLLKQFTPTSPVGSKGSTQQKLSQMKLSGFKKWLRTVAIVEPVGEKTTFEFDGTAMVSTRPARLAPRIHQGSEVELGVITIPFSTDIAVIRVADDLQTATVRYDQEPQLEAKIVPKK